VSFEFSFFLSASIPMGPGACQALPDKLESLIISIRLFVLLTVFRVCLALMAQGSGVCPFPLNPFIPSFGRSRSCDREMIPCSAD
jgi:hypothetical protein